MLTLYHVVSGRSFRIRWLLEELQIPYDFKTIDFSRDEHRSPAFLAINPMGSIPVLKDDDFVLIESGAIINYLLAHYSDGRFSYPVGSREAALVDQWMWWSESLFAFHQRTYWGHTIGSSLKAEDKVPKIGYASRSAALLCAEMLERHLREDGYAVGDKLTGADFMLCYPLYLAWLENWFEALPKVKAYVERLIAHPALADAIEDTRIHWIKRIEAKPTIGTTLELASQT